MARYFFITCILSASLFLSCKKEKKAPEPEPCPAPAPAPAVTYNHFLPFKKGNYWIYERVQVAMNGSTVALNQFDSVVVEKDTSIRNLTYWKIRKFDFIYNRPEYVYQRDSLHYIVDSKGTICFSSEDFSTVFSEFYQISSNNDTICRIYSKMNDKDLKFTTSAGTFVTSNFQKSINVFPNWSPAGIPNPRYMNTRYCKDLGIIVESEAVFLSVPYTIEKRLIRHHLVKS